MKAFTDTKHLAVTNQREQRMLNAIADLNRARVALGQNQHAEARRIINDLKTFLPSNSPTRTECNEILWAMDEHYYTIASDLIGEMIATVAKTYFPTPPHLRQNP